MCTVIVDVIHELNLTFCGKYVFRMTWKKPIPVYVVLVRVTVFDVAHDISQEMCFLRLMIAKIITCSSLYGSMEDHLC